MEVFFYNAIMMIFIMLYGLTLYYTNIVIYGLTDLSEWANDIRMIPFVTALLLISLLEEKYIAYILLFLLFFHVNMIVLTVALIYSIRRLLGWWTGCFVSVQETTSAVRYVKSTVMSGIDNLIRWCSGYSSHAHGLWPWYEISMAVLHVVSIVFLGMIGMWIFNHELVLVHKLYFYGAHMTGFFPVVLISMTPLGIRYVSCRWIGHPYPIPLLLILLLYEMDMVVLMGITTLVSGIRCLIHWFTQNPEPIHWWVESQTDPKVSRQTIIPRPVSLITLLHAVKTSVLMVMSMVVSRIICLIGWGIGDNELDIRLSYKMRTALSAVTSGIRHLKNWWNGNPKPLILPNMELDLDNHLFSNATQKPTDFRIKVEDKIIHVHKSILCAVSDYFLVMLLSGMKESEEGMIHIQNTKADVVETMIGYFYGQTTSIDWNHIKDYVDIVELWQIAEVKDILEDYIAENVTPHNSSWTDWFHHADTYHMEHLQEEMLTDLLSPYPNKATQGRSQKLNKKAPTTDTFKKIIIIINLFVFFNSVFLIY